MTRFSEGTYTQSDIFKDAIGVSQSESWFSTRSGAPRLASIGIHIGLVGLALVPWRSSLPMRPKINETAIVLYTPSAVLLKPLSLPGRTGGGGGGGKRQP